MTDQDREPKEPEEVARLRGDISGKEPVVVEWRDSTVLEEAVTRRDWELVLRAVEAVERLYPETHTEYGRRKRHKAKNLSVAYRNKLRTDFEEVSASLQAELEEYNAAQVEEYRRAGLRVPGDLEDQIETRFHDAVDHLGVEPSNGGTVFEMTAEQRQALYYKGLPGG